MDTLLCTKGIDFYSEAAKKLGVSRQTAKEQLYWILYSTNTLGEVSMRVKELFIEDMNAHGVPEDDLFDNGGRVPWEYEKRYGNWLEENDPIAFWVAYRDWQRERFKMLKE